MQSEAYKKLMAQHYFEKNLGEKAMQAYFKKYGDTAPMPSSPRFEYVDNGVRVILENVNGKLASYLFEKPLAQ